MAKYQTGTYAKTYAFGMDGSAALTPAQQEIHRESVSREETRQESRRFQATNRGMAVLLVLALVMVATVHIRQATQIAATQSAVKATQNSLLSTEAEISALRQRYDAACEESYVRTVAVNRLGMQMPTDEQTHRIPPLQVADPSQQAVEAPREAPSWLQAFFRTIRSMIGS